MEVLITSHGLLEFKIEIGTAEAETSLPKYINFSVNSEVGTCNVGFVFVMSVYYTVFVCEMHRKTLYINERRFLSKSRKPGRIQSTF